MLRFNFNSKNLESCRPPAWARTGHLQTILGHLLPSPELQQNGERVELTVANGDKLVCHFYPGTSDTVVYVFHGLGGTSHGTYMQRTALIAQSLGHSVFLFNHRGCGEGEGLAREPYHSGRSEDLSALIAYGRARLPAHKHVAIGFSLSGNAVLLLAARQRADVLPDAAIAVNAPINLARCSILLQRGLNKLYDFRFMNDMRKAVASRVHHDVSLKTLQIPFMMTLTDFDDMYTAPFSGFKNRDHYYSTCSANQYLKDVVIPTVLLTAEDDPFVDVQDYHDAKLSPLVHRHIEKVGGHMGYLTRARTPLGTNRWLDYALWYYLSALRE